MEGDTEHSHVLYVVSDATGGTARRVVDAALLQFSGAKVVVEQVPGVREAKEVRRLVKQAAEAGATIVHVDVTNKSIEECAAEIIALQGHRMV